ncbi:DUF1697 domain-containing protein [Diaphorobacter sp. HDW4A]|uniref:DUF1697 domain-containing protein n=1 Tax=Diaphorobacter sp. HDW4A TaxID=2714924 RepID=UPI001408855B|nr:DUF1697 domain-containing protein [Diaphorobacter sp. HDW4A]QIL81918.1 DUF1697 domain-containing protein [Diaphorobacter sp. HDW4A]
MERYVAFLRGVSPMNCKMPELKRCFEAAGFVDVKTLLSSGNVAFSARPEVVPVLERMAEETMEKHLGKRFMTIVRPSAFLQSLVARAPFAEFALAANAKPVVTFLLRPCEGTLTLPLEQAQAAILKLEGTEVFSAYVPNEKGPVFMALLEKTFGKQITTRTLDTVRKCAAA